jgi:hypothetical protein
VSDFLGVVSEFLAGMLLFGFAVHGPESQGEGHPVGVLCGRQSPDGIQFEQRVLGSDRRSQQGRSQHRLADTHRSRTPAPTGGSQPAARQSELGKSQAQSRHWNPAQ